MHYREAGRDSGLRSPSQISEAGKTLQVFRSNSAASVCSHHRARHPFKVERRPSKTNSIIALRPNESPSRQQRQARELGPADR
jgi:hypothetical protein